MQNWIEHLPEIIQVASKDLRSLTAFAIAISSFFAGQLFKNSKDVHKVSIFISLLFFIVSLIVITSQAPNIQDGSHNESYINPFIAAGIWGTSALIYLYFLRSHWQENLKSKKYSQDFLLFVFDDLIGLKDPLILFPILPISLLPFFILDGATAGVLIFIASIPSCVFLWFLLSSLPIRRHKIRRKAILSHIDNQWLQVKKELDLALAQRAWLNYHELSDLLENLDIFDSEDEQLDLIRLYDFDLYGVIETSSPEGYKLETWLKACEKVMDKYSAHTSGICRGKVIERGFSGGHCVSNTYIGDVLFPQEQRVLINMKNFPSKKYRIE